MTSAHQKIGRCLSFSPLLGLIFLGACLDPGISASDSQNAISEDHHVLCTSDTECPDTEVCRRGLCSISDYASSVAVALEVRPPHSNSVARRFFGAQSFSTDELELVVQRREQVAGELTTTNGEPPPDGVILLVDDRGLNEAIQRPLRDGEFDLRAAPGDYDLIYIADDPRWPRIPLDSLQIDESLEELQFQIPSFDELRVVTGTLTRELLDLLGLLTEPVEGARVIASGQSAGFRSPTALTDEDGEFLLRLPPGEDTFDVLVEPGPNAEFVPFASFAAEIVASTDDIALSLGELELDLLSVTADIIADPVEGRAPSWEDFRIEFRRSLDIGELILSPAIADGGTVALDVLVGTYDIEVQAPPGSPWGSASTTASLLSTLSSVEIELPLRTRVVGRVTHDDGRPIADASLRARRTNTNIQLPPGRTDDDGNFELWVDEGDYVIAVASPLDLGLPHHIEEFSVEAGADEIALNLVVPRGFVATGSVIGTDGAAVGHASIRATHPDFDGLIIGKTQARGSGAFGLLLSPALFD